MFNQNRVLRGVAAVVSISLVAGCGVFSSSAEAGGPIVVGTTSAPSTLDPAGSWDGSWELFRNIYQTLLAYPDGATTPSPTPPRAAPSRTQATAPTTVNCAPA